MAPAPGTGGVFALEVSQPVRCDAMHKSTGCGWVVCVYVGKETYEWCQWESQRR